MHNIRPIINNRKLYTAKKWKIVGIRASPAVKLKATPRGAYRWRASVYLSEGLTPMRH